MWKGESLLDIRNRPNLLHALHPALLLNFSAVCFGYDLSSGTAHSDFFLINIEKYHQLAFSQHPMYFPTYFRIVLMRPRSDITYWNQNGKKYWFATIFFAISSIAMIEQAWKGFRLLSPRWGLYKVSIFCVHCSKLTQIMVRECSCLIFDQNSRKSF